MPELEYRMQTRILYLTLSLLLVLFIYGCGGSRVVLDPAAAETRSDKTGDSTNSAELADNEADSKRPYSYRSSSLREHEEKSQTAVAVDSSGNKIGSSKIESNPHGAGESKRTVVIPSLYSGSLIIEDSAFAVDDYIWRQFDLAGEYHSMGVIANREAGWEEAQYYFDKALSILADLDVETDSSLTPEAVKYNSLLDNIIADYRVALRSLGELTDDVTPAVMLERYGIIGRRLEGDTMRVFNQETRQITYDLPVIMNDRVKASIIYFQTVAKEAFYKYLRRKPRYERMFREVLAEKGLPQDLIYLSLVESGYNPKAYSWARASGLWQFISSTGRMYGLKRDWWVDERRDPIKSTHAAARFLGDLYKKFGHWELAMAAYNGGPGRVSRTIKKQKTDDFWKLRLKRQTMDYVPLIYAAAIIGKNPSKYGFNNFETEEEIRWEEVNIDRALDLKVVARAIGTTVAKLKEVNPELLRNYTPPNRKKYTLKLPVGFKQKFMAAYDKMPSPKQTSWVKHRIKRGETVSSIAAKYGVSQYSITSSNNISRRSRIYAGKTLIVPVPLDGGSRGRKKNKNYTADNSMYRVRSGDTMWDIARAFGTSVDGLRRINSIRRGSRIYVGQRLKIPSNAKKLRNKSRSTPRVLASTKSTGAKPPTMSSRNSANSRTYKVRSGDTLWDIARMYGTTTSKIRRWNGLGRSSRIYPGQLLAVEGSAGPDFVLHKVRRGETLSRIAQKYRTNISKIQATNGLTNPDQLRVGTKLKIYK